MRNNKALDYWQSIEKTKEGDYSGCSYINLFGVNGFDTISLTNKLQIFCGLNGAGKTTVLTAIKAILGINVSEHDNQKISNTKYSGVIEGRVRFHGKSYNCLNYKGERLCDQIDTDDYKYLQYHDYFNILRIVDFITTEPNLEDFLESNEPIILNEKQITEINYLVGKEYKSVTVYEIEDITELGIIPFFIVDEVDGSYDSKRMGTGEYALLYLYWNIQQNKTSIILIEEPESFIAIDSQRKLMDFIAKSISKKNNSFIISTHSPFILTNVKNKYIKILSSAYGRTIVDDSQMGNASELLGLKEKGVGVIYVEDGMAKAFLEVFAQKENIPLNKYYDIRISNGCSELSNLLKLGMLKESPFTILGLYDDDQRGIVPNDVVLPYGFLPPKKDVESAFKDLLTTEKNFKKICIKLRIEEKEYVRILSKLKGVDRHDWFSYFTKEINHSEQVLLHMFYDLWKTGKAQDIKDFKKSLLDLTGIPM